MLKITNLILVLAFLKLNNSSLVTDIAHLVTTATYQCFKANGYPVALVNGYCANSGVDRITEQTLLNALSAGVVTHVTMFPCQNYNASYQVEQMFHLIAPNLYTKVWLSVETTLGPRCNWSKDPAANCKILLELLQLFRQAGLETGVGSSQKTWQ